VSRPRIRTLKPEFWADERVGGLSRDARLALVGLVTMADDEGRLRALPAGIVGHAYPYDGVTPRRLAGWLDELAATQIVVRYEHAGQPYVAFRQWRSRKDMSDPLVAQLITRPSASLLPAPPDAAIRDANAVTGLSDAPTDAAHSVNDHGGLSDRSRASRASADRIGSDRKGTEFPPTPPAGGRARDKTHFEEQMRSYVASLLPGAPEDCAVPVVRGALHGGARDDQAVVAFIERARPELLNYLAAEDT
jgi:hypothetical protein